MINNYAVNFKSKQISSGENNVNSEVKQESKDDRPVVPKVRSIGGTLTALTLGTYVSQVLGEYVSAPFQMGFIEKSTLKEKDGKVVHQALNKMIKDSGLKENGVRIKFLNPLTKSSKKCMENSKKSKTLYKDYFDSIQVNPVRDGYNAFFIPKNVDLPLLSTKEYFEQPSLKRLSKTRTYIKANSVLLPKNKLHTAGFHELGHALNYNMSTIGKLLQKCRPISSLGPIIIGIYSACSKKSKPKDENDKLNGRQKTKNFIRDNAGKLSFAMTLPMLIEEGMATLKGQKYAKKLLKPELAKQVFKANAFAYATYLCTAIFISLDAFVSTKIKDAFVKRKENKIMARLEAKQKILSEMKNS